MIGDGVNLVGRIRTVKVKNEYVNARSFTTFNCNTDMSYNTAIGYVCFCGSGLKLQIICLVLLCMWHYTQSAGVAFNTAGRYALRSEAMGDCE